MNKIITLIALLTSFSLFAGTGDSCVSCKDKHVGGEVMYSAKKLSAKANVKLNYAQRKMICDEMLDDHKLVEYRVKMETGLSFADGYKQVTCPVVGDQKVGWDLIGIAFRRPPSKKPIKVVRELFSSLRKSNPSLLKYIYTHKDYKGRGIYNYLSLAEKKYSKNDKYKKYYKYFEKQLVKFDPTVIPPEK